MAAEATAVTASTRNDAGSRRRMRRAVEPPEGHAAGVVDLPPQVIGDQVARDHEEDVDAHVAAGHGPDVGVVEDDGEDGDRVETLDVLAERAPRSARRTVSLRLHQLITPRSALRGER